MAKAVTVYAVSGFVGRISFAAGIGGMACARCGRRPNEALFVRTYGNRLGMSNRLLHIRDECMLCANVLRGACVVNCVWDPGRGWQEHL